jgi:hypothetical protein
MADLLTAFNLLFILVVHCSLIVGSWRTYWIVVLQIFLELSHLQTILRALKSVHKGFIHPTRFGTDSFHFQGC